MFKKKKEKRQALIAAGVIIVIAVIVGAYIAGSRAPERHVAFTTRSLDQSPEQVWNVIASIDGQANWRDDVNAIEVIRYNELAQPVFVESRKGKDITKEVIEFEGIKKIETQTIDTESYRTVLRQEVYVEGGKTQFTVTEIKDIYNPFKRFMHVYLGGADRSVDTYADQVAAEVERRFANQ